MLRKPRRKFKEKKKELPPNKLIHLQSCSFFYNDLDYIEYREEYHSVNGINNLYQLNYIYLKNGKCVIERGWKWEICNEIERQIRGVK